MLNKQTQHAAENWRSTGHPNVIGLTKAPDDCVQTGYTHSNGMFTAFGYCLTSMFNCALQWTFLAIIYLVLQHLQFHLSGSPFYGLFLKLSWLKHARLFNAHEKNICWPFHSAQVVDQQSCIMSPQVLFRADDELATAVSQPSNAHEGTARQD